jgi:hypothetical protein
VVIFLFLLNLGSGYFLFLLNLGSGYFVFLLNLGSGYFLFLLNLDSGIDFTSVSTILQSYFETLTTVVFFVFHFMPTQ